MNANTVYIGGEWVESSGSSTIEAISPHTEEVIGSVPAATPADIDRAVAAARAAFDEGSWTRTSAGERAKVLRSMASAIKDQSQEFADTIVKEMGAPSGFVLFGQVLSAAMIVDGIAELVESYPFEEPRPGLLGSCLVEKAPVGVCAGVVPWNMPLSLMATKLATALGSGSTMVIKGSPETPLTAYLFAGLLDSLDLPPGVVSVLVADRDVSEHLVSHAGVDKVSFTGSTAVGRRIGSICGENLKRCTLELGGKSAAIVLDDADIDSIASQLVGLAYVNNGQTCAAQTRVLAPKSRLGEVVDALAAAVSKAVVGDPADPATTIGPLVAARQRERVERYIRSGVDEGARLVAGGGRPAGLDRGWYVEPTVFADVDNGMRIAREEIFGPVLSIIEYDGEDEAVRLSNESDYGLSGSVWGGSNEHCATVAKRLRTGSVAVNSSMIADIKNPFGGFKRSGIGREMGREGLEAYLETQTLVMPPG